MIVSSLRVYTVLVKAYAANPYLSTPDYRWIPALVTAQSGHVTHKLVLAHTAVNPRFASL